MSDWVVIPVGGRVSLQTIENVRRTAEVAHASNCRVVVVDDNASGTPDLVAATPLAVTIRTSGGNSYVARNAAIEFLMSTDADRVAFTDSDCVVGAGWPRHLLSHLNAASAVTGLAPPSGPSMLAKAASADYTRRLLTWGAVEKWECGTLVNMLDTRAAAISMKIFREHGYRFDSRVRHAGDAILARVLVRDGFTVVGCGQPNVAHEAPASWIGDSKKYFRVARRCTQDIRQLERKEVLALLPEHAHIRLTPSRKRVVRSLTKLGAAVLDGPRVGIEATNIALYERMRELAWTLGWYLESRSARATR